MRSGNEEEGSSYDVQQRCFGGGWNKYCRFQLRLDHNLFVNPLLTSERQNINLWEKIRQSFGCGLVKEIGL